jgi:hypothetical protein
MRYKYHRLSHYLSSSSLSAPLYSKNSESLGPCFALLPQLFENVLLVYTCLPLSIAVHPKIQNRSGMSCVSASLNQGSKKMELMLCGSFWTVSRGLYILLNFLSWLSPSHSAISLFPKFPCKVPHAVCLSLCCSTFKNLPRNTSCFRAVQFCKEIRIRQQRSNVLPFCCSLFERRPTKYHATSVFLRWRMCDINITHS